MIGDAVLGLRLWLGPLIATGYYEKPARPWGPDLRLDQAIAAELDASAPARLWWEDDPQLSQRFRRR